MAFQITKKSGTQPYDLQRSQQDTNAEKSECAPSDHCYTPSSSPIKLIPAVFVFVGGIFAEYKCNLVDMALKGIRKLKSGAQSIASTSFKIAKYATLIILGVTALLALVFTINRTYQHYFEMEETLKKEKEKIKTLVSEREVTAVKHSLPDSGYGEIMDSLLHNDNLDTANYLGLINPNNRKFKNMSPIILQKAIDKAIANKRVAINNESSLNSSSPSITTKDDDDIDHAQAIAMEEQTDTIKGLEDVRNKLLYSKGNLRKIKFALHRTLIYMNKEVRDLRN